jgi:hypothetical protein
VVCTDSGWMGPSSAHRTGLTRGTSPSPPADAARVQTGAVFQTWSPNDFQTVLDKWVAAGKSVADLATSTASVAKVAMTTFK